MILNLNSDFLEAYDNLNEEVEEVSDKLSKQAKVFLDKAAKDGKPVDDLKTEIKRIEAEFEINDDEDLTESELVKWVVDNVIFEPETTELNDDDTYFADANDIDFKEKITGCEYELEKDKLVLRIYVDLSARHEFVTKSKFDYWNGPQWDSRDYWVDGKSDITVEFPEGWKEYYDWSFPDYAEIYDLSY